MSKFSARLRELRTSREISMQALANYIGMSKSSINMYERDEREPGLETLEAIADFFNVDVDYLLGKTQIANKYMESNIFENNDNKRMLNDEGVNLYLKLDTEDKAEIRGEMRQMLKKDKYKSSIKTKKRELFSEPRSSVIAAYGSEVTSINNDDDSSEE